MSNYRATRIEGKLIGEGASPYQYIEVLNIDGLDAYNGGVRRPPHRRLQELIGQVFSHVDDRDRARPVRRGRRVERDRLDDAAVRPP